MRVLVFPSEAATFANRFTGTRAWVSYHMYSFIWHVSIHPCPKFNSGLVTQLLNLHVDVVV